jgi:hypothetical protein
MIRTLNSAYSVIEVWRRLVASADFKVLRGERRALRAREKYLEAERLFLRWEQEGEKRDGPAYLIVKVCEAALDVFPWPSRPLRHSLYPDGAAFFAAPSSSHSIRSVPPLLGCLTDQCLASGFSSNCHQLSTWRSTRCT